MRTSARLAIKFGNILAPLEAREKPYHSRQPLLCLHRRFQLLSSWKRLKKRTILQPTGSYPYTAPTNTQRQLVLLNYLRRGGAGAPVFASWKLCATSFLLHFPPCPMQPLPPALADACLTRRPGGISGSDLHGESGLLGMKKNEGEKRGAKRRRTAKKAAPTLGPSSMGPTVCLESKTVAEESKKLDTSPAACPVSAVDLHDLPAPVLREQQERLVLLRHAARCTAAPGLCANPEHSDTIRVVWCHVRSCRRLDCPFLYCLSSRFVLHHYSRCRDSNCDVCRPVRSLIDSTRKQ